MCVRGDTVAGASNTTRAECRQVENPSASSAAANSVACSKQ